MFNNDIFRYVTKCCVTLGPNYNPQGSRLMKNIINFIPHTLYKKSRKKKGVLSKDHFLASLILDIINVPITNVDDDDTTSDPTQTPTLKIQCQSAILGWLIKFTADLLKKPKLEKASVSVISNMSTGDEVDGKESMPAESTSIDDEKLAEIIPIVRSVLYATKDNVLLIHEIFRQVSFMMFYDVVVIKVTLYEDVKFQQNYIRIELLSSFLLKAIFLFFHFFWCY